MEATSQIMESGRYYRVCNSCLRNLNICEFGSLWSGRQGLNSTCKACRRERQKGHYRKNYRRKRAYNVALPGVICSLDRNNRDVLLMAAQKSTVSVSALSMLDGATWTIQIETDREVRGVFIQVHIVIPDGTVALTMQTPFENWSALLDCVVLELRRRALRLRGLYHQGSAEADFLSYHVPAALTSNST